MENSEKRKLNPRYIPYSFTVGAIAKTVVLIIIFFTVGTPLIIGGTNPFPVVAISLGILFAVLLFEYAWTALVYHFYRYEIRPEEFRKEYGVINKKYVSIPYTRIQNIDINRGLLQRIFKLSSLKIQTAGDSGALGAEGSIPGLSPEGAEKLREELLDHARNIQNPTPQQPPVQPL